MKTFEESFETIYPHTGIFTTKTEIDAEQFSLAIQTPRYQSFIRNASQHFCESVMRGECLESLLHQHLHTTFVVGLLTGIEMEKS